MKIFDNAKIKYQKDFYTCGYFLDFKFDNNCYIEIDGDQHYSDKRIVEHDRLRTEKLDKNGFKLLCRIRWSTYKSLNDSQKKDFVNNLLKLILDNTIS